MKRVTCAFLCLAAAFLFCSCAKQPEKQVKGISDLSAFAEALLATGAFSDELSPVASEIGCELYGMEPDIASEMLFYMSSGATAEELVLFRCNGDTQTKLLQLCGERGEMQKSLYASYKPEEVPKLENAIPMCRGDVVMWCVSADPELVSRFLDSYSDEA